MSWKAKFRSLEGWVTDLPSFPTRKQAVRYALARANRHTRIIDFDVVKCRQTPNSSVCA